MIKPVGACFCLLALVLAVVFADVSSTDWFSWLTSQNITTTQGVLVITGAVSHQGGRAWILWDRCFRHNYGQLTPYECVTEIGTAFLQWAVALAALGKITGWYKRDDESHGGVFQIGPIGAISIIDYELHTSLGKRDDHTGINFEIDGESYQHISSVYTYVASSNYSLSLIGHSNTSTNDSYGPHYQSLRLQVNNLF